MDFIKNLFSAIMVKSIGVAIIVVLAIVHFTDTLVIYDQYEKPEFSLSQGLNALAEQNAIDFSTFENGNWTRLCLFGGNTYPYLQMDRYGSIGIFDSINGYLKRAPMVRDAEVEGSELLIAYVDQNNRVHFVHTNEVPRLEKGKTLKRLTRCLHPDEPIFRI